MGEHFSSASGVYGQREIQALKIQEDFFQLRLPQDGNRSVGTHLSEILRDLAFKMKVLDKKFDTPIEDSNTHMMQLGLAMEDYLAKYQHPEIEFHPGELVLDGIAMSPDGISTLTDSEDYSDLVGVEEGTLILHEFKLTRKSSRDFKESLRLQAKKCKMWLWQIMAYRHAFNCIAGPGQECYIAKLHVWFVNGNYSRDDSDPDSGPSYKIYRLVFTPQELLENWQMIVSHCSEMRIEGKLQYEQKLQDGEQRVGEPLES